MILLLTGCINPDGMAYTALCNVEERKKQYVNAIQFYLSSTNYPIVFTENSGTDISSRFEDSIKQGRLECLTFHGNHHKEKGKGYGECEIIEYALDHSHLIQTAHGLSIAKITGRLIVRNINRIIRLHRFFFSCRTVFCSINSDLSFPDSRLIVAPIDFYRTFLKSKDDINDSKGYFFEHALCDTLKRETNYPYVPFIFMPRIEGSSGSTGAVYVKEAKSWPFTFKYIKYALSQYRRFNKLYRDK